MAQAEKVIFRARHCEWAFPRPAVVMGILNVTPDSFSDGGQFLEPSVAIDRAFQMVEEGAEIIDLGGESTRPQARPVSETEELRRVMPVLKGLAGRLKALISIDTYKPAVAREALQAGANLVNDIGALRQDSAMWEIVGQARAGYVVMHMQGNPQTMQENPSYQDVVGEVEAFFIDRLSRLAQAGIDAKSVALDVGIGFGKTPEHNRQLLAGLGRFAALGRPMMIGVSRKSFLGGLSGSDPGERLPAALACACWSVQAGAQIIRTHDVSATLRAIRMTEALQAAQDSPGQSLPRPPLRSFL